jgi:hypothetical protein
MSDIDLNMLHEKEENNIWVRLCNWKCHLYYFLFLYWTQIEKVTFSYETIWSVIKQIKLTQFFFSSLFSHVHLIYSNEECRKTTQFFYIFSRALTPKSSSKWFLVISALIVLWITRTMMMMRRMMTRKEEYFST